MSIARARRSMSAGVARNALPAPSAPAPGLGDQLREVASLDLGQPDQHRWITVECGGGEVRPARRQSRRAPPRPHSDTDDVAGRWLRSGWVRGFAVGLAQRPFDRRGPTRQSCGATAPRGRRPPTATGTTSSQAQPRFGIAPAMVRLAPHCARRSRRTSRRRVCDQPEFCQRIARCRCPLSGAHRYQ